MLSGRRGGRPRARRSAITVKGFGVCLAAVVFVLAGCGSSGSKTATTSSSTASRPTGFLPPQTPPPSNIKAATIGVASGAVAPNGTFRARYTCHGEEITPQLSWKGLPGVLEDAKEIVVLAHTFTRHGITTNWAIANISPSVDYIEATELPKGAILGKNSYGKVGYTMCPPKGALISIGIDALPRKVPLKQGFDPKELDAILESGEVHWGSVEATAG